MTTKRYGSHIPMLVRAWDLSSGEVLELGTGVYSTQLLYWLAGMSGRHVTSYETKPEWYEKAKGMNSRFHSIRLIQSWTEADLERPWGVALVDHGDQGQRWQEALRLKDWADYIVIHDSNDQRMGYDKLFSEFKWVYRYTKLIPNTAVLSNKHSLECFP